MCYEVEVIIAGKSDSQRDIEVGTVLRNSLKKDDTRIKAENEYEKH